jgi:hypothetical protein
MVFILERFCPYDIIPVPMGSPEMMMSNHPNDNERGTQDDETSDAMLAVVMLRGSEMVSWYEIEYVTAFVSVNS